MSNQPGYPAPGAPRPGMPNPNNPASVPGSTGFPGMPPPGMPTSQPGVGFRPPGMSPMIPRPGGVPPGTQPSQSPGFGGMKPPQSLLPSQPRPGMPMPRPASTPNPAHPGYATGVPNAPGMGGPVPMGAGMGAVPGPPSMGPSAMTTPGFGGPAPGVAPAPFPTTADNSMTHPPAQNVPGGFPGGSRSSFMPPRTNPSMPGGGAGMSVPGSMSAPGMAAPGAPSINTFTGPGGMGVPPPGMPTPGVAPPGVPAPGTGPPGMPGAPMRPPPFGAPKGPGVPGFGPAPGVGSPMALASPTSPAVEQLLNSVEQLSLGPATPGGDAMVNPNSLPRPTGEQGAAAHSIHPEPTKGSCDVSFMRMTVGCIPQSQAVRSRWQLPLGIIVQPLAECGIKVPVIAPGIAGIQRCRRCRTYINPFVQWTDGGRRWKCNVCTMFNEVPNDFFCSLDEYGIRRDVNERPELSLGSVEYVAPEEYMVRAPMPPSYFFLIDVSVTAVQSGVLKSICEGIRDSLNHLPGGDRTRIGFMTYDRTLHFYNLRSSSSTPQMMVIGEIDEPFVPVPDDLLVELSECRDSVESLLQQLPNSFSGKSAPVDSAMGPALQAALMVISSIGGKLVVFQGGIPSLGAGKINNRENVKLYGSDREHVLRNPEDLFFKNFASECNRAQITVDFFSFCPQYVDLASLSAIPKYTCGSLHYYPGFNPGQSNRLRTEIKKLLGKEIAWEAVMRIRSSRGLQITNFLGHFFVRSSDLLALPTADQDKTFAASIKHEESVLADPFAYIQCALLYTASCGERRIRVHTLAVPVVMDLNELYRMVDGAATAVMMAKLGVEKSYSSKLEECRQAVLQKVMLGFKEFRIMHSQHFRAPNQLACPPALKYIPAWILGITKSAALRAWGRDSIPDERIAIGFEIMQASIEQVLTIAYPTIYRIDNQAGEWGREKPGQTNGTIKVELPLTLPASYQILDPSGVYLIDNGRIFVLWVGRTAGSKLYQELFEVQGPNESAQLNVEPARNSEISQRLNSVVNSLRDQRSTQQQCFVVVQGSPVEAHILPLFVEDRGVGSESLLDCLQNIQRSATKM